MVVKEPVARALPARAMPAMPAAAVVTNRDLTVIGLPLLF
jgi:hypothetical protein